MPITKRPRPHLRPAIDQLRRRWYQVPLVYDAHYANGYEGRRPGSLHGLVIAVLDRLFPHDTLYVGGRPYMHRWYVFGYAPIPDDPDAAMICATCKAELRRSSWRTEPNGSPLWMHDRLPTVDHDPVPVSAPRAGWRWQDHGLGAFRIHCTTASDDSRAFHDHPWPFASIIVRGAYREVQPVPFAPPPEGLTGIDRIVWYPTPADQRWTTRRVFRAPALNVKRATDLHVLEVVDGPVWSLFFTRPKVRSWGFAGPFGWLPWRAFDEQYPERDAYTEQGGATFRRERLGEWPVIVEDPSLEPGVVELRHDDGTVVGRITGVGQ